MTAITETSLAAAGPIRRRKRKGRLMEALQGAGESREARKAAVDYLRDYPSGPHAALARDIQEANTP